MGLSQPPFGFIFPFSWYIVRLQLINFTMVNDDRKEELRPKKMHHATTLYQKKPNAQQEQIDSDSELKKPKSVLGFEPGLPRQNTDALPLMLPPLPGIAINMSLFAIYISRLFASISQKLCQTHDITFYHGSISSIHNIFLRYKPLTFFQ